MVRWISRYEISKKKLFFILFFVYKKFQIKIQMGQASEKLLSVEEKYKGIEKERDDMKRKIKEFEAKMDVLTRSEQAMSKDANERLKQLEKALEEALIGKDHVLKK